MTGERKMLLMLATKNGRRPGRQFLSGEQRSGLDDVPLTMHPVRLNWIEPGALRRQVTRDHTHALAGLSHRAIVRLNPVAHILTDVPGGVVPDHQQRLFADLFQLGAASGQILGGDATDRAAFHETQPDLFRLDVGCLCAAIGLLSRYQEVDVIQIIALGWDHAVILSHSCPTV